MAVEITVTKPIFRNEGVTSGVVGERLINKLRQTELEFRRPEAITDHERFRAFVLPIFSHASVKIGIGVDFNTGTMRMRTWLMTQDRYQEVVGRGGFFYWNPKFAGKTGTPENIANFTGEAAKQLEAHQTAILRGRLPGATLIIH